MHSKAKPATRQGTSRVKADTRRSRRFQRAGRDRLLQLETQPPEHQHEPRRSPHSDQGAVRVPGGWRHSHHLADSLHAHG
jgi:hypothetical protein